MSEKRIGFFARYLTLWVGLCVSLATVVGVLVEVPVMLSLVKIAKLSRGT